MEIQYQLIQTDRKTLGMSVERDRTIIVRAPTKISKQEIEQFIERKKYWLYTKLNHPQKYKKQRKTEFISGAAILYLGRNYKLDVTKEDINKIEFNNKFTISKKNQRQASKLFKEWYIEQAYKKILPKAKRYAKNIGVEFNNIKITDLKYRWGSCTLKNNLNFNWKLIKAPLPVIEYVIVHELAHLIEPNHTRKFWSIVKTQLPRYKEAKNWLKENGHLLEVDF